MKKVCFYCSFLVYLAIIASITSCQKSKNKNEPSLYGNIEDSLALYFESPHFKTYPNGRKDNTSQLQKAINQLNNTRRFGIIFIPSGTYRLDSTINLWRGIRLIGYGKTKPEFVLKKDQMPHGTKPFHYMVRFCDFRKPYEDTVRDADNTTFFSGINNINFRIEDNNDSAVAVRYRVAQHSSLENIHFDIGSGYAAIHNIGNEIENCTVKGGKYGIMTKRTSAGWPSLLLNNVFNNQRKACIRSKEAGLTLINCRFLNSDHVIEVPKNQYEHIFMEKCLLQNISKEAIVVSNDIQFKRSKVFNPAPSKNPDHLTCVNINNVYCDNVNKIIHLREKNKTLKTDHPQYKINDIGYGFAVSGSGKGKLRISKKLKVLKKIPSFQSFRKDIPQLPKSKNRVNVTNLGLKGNGKFDNTARLRQAIQDYNYLYFPQGTYLISDSVKLNANTALIGLHPHQTVLRLKEKLPAFNDSLQPKGMLYVPANAESMISGIGIDPQCNKGAAGIVWKGSKNSLLNDVLFGIYESRYDSLPKSEDQYVSLWIKENGGGHFKNFWSHDIIAQHGLKISETSTEGNIYQASVEHHKHLEVDIDEVENWNLYALQTEENKGSKNAYAIDIHQCNNLKFANTYMYRIEAISESYPSAIKIYGSNNIIFHGIHNFSWGPHYFKNSVLLRNKNKAISRNAIGRLQLSSDS